MITLDDDLIFLEFMELFKFSSDFFLLFVRLKIKSVTLNWVTQQMPINQMTSLSFPTINI